MEVQIMRDGGLLVSGTTQDLKSLALHLLNAVHEGHANPTFVADRGVTSILIQRTD